MLAHIGAQLVRLDCLQYCFKVMAYKHMYRAEIHIFCTPLTGSMFGLVLRIKGSRMLIPLCCVTATKRENCDSIHIEQTGASALQQLPSLTTFFMGR